MGPQDWLPILHRRWPLILGAALVAVAAALVATQGPTPEQELQQGSRDQIYQANVLLLQTAELDFGNLETLATLTSIGEVPRRVAAELGMDTPSDIPAEVIAEGNTDTGFLTISATGRDREEIERIADTYATSMIEWLTDREAEQSEALVAQITGQIDDLTADVSELDTIARTEGGSAQIVATAELEAKTRQLAALEERLQQLLAPPPDAGLSVVQPAQAMQVLPEASDFAAVVPQSRPAQLGAATLLGLLLGIGLALIVESTDRRIRTREQVEEHLGLPVLAEVPRQPHRARGVDGPWAINAFGLLAAAVDSAPRTADPDVAGAPVTLVTSPLPGDGRTTVVESLAAYARGIGQTVSVVHGNVQPGATDPSTTRSNNGPGDALATRRLVLREARRNADIVLIDAPPLLAAGDAAHLLRDVDAVVVVVRGRRTTRDEAVRTRQLLELFGSVPGFAVLNGVSEQSTIAAAPLPATETGTRGLSSLARHFNDA